MFQTEHFMYSLIFLISLKQVLANTEGDISDSLCRNSDQESDRGNAWMESKCSRDRQSVSRAASNLADTESQQSSSSNNRGEPREVSQSEQIQSGRGRGGGHVADTESIGVQGLWSSGEQVAYSHEGQTLSMCHGEGGRKGLWPTEPNVGRVANGIPRRVDRIKGLGNAIVPQIAYRIGLCIKEAETD